jgi:hypothetical protein
LVQECSKIALPFRADAFRVVCAVQLAEEIWVVHAFQKKSTQGIKTPRREIDLIRDRLKWLTARGISSCFQEAASARKDRRAQSPYNALLPGG